MTPSPNARAALDERLTRLFELYRREDDEEALEELMEIADAELNRVARRFAQSPDEVEDLIGETWAVVFEKAGRFDTRQRLMPWLVGIATNLGLEMRRRAARRPTTIAEAHEIESAFSTPAGVERPDEAAERAEEHGIIRMIIARLSGRSREVVMLSASGLSNPEIAERLNRSEGAVRVQLHRGLKQMRDLLPAGMSLGAALALFAPRSEAARLAPIVERAGHAAAGNGGLTASTAVAAGGVLAAWKLAGLALAITALVAGGAWIVGSRDGSVARTSALAVTTPDARTDRARGTTLSGTAASTERAPALVLKTSDATATSARSGVWLVADVDGLADLPAAPLKLTLRREKAAERVETVTPRAVIDPGSARSAQRIEVDVTDWYVDGAARPREFHAVLDQALALPATISLWLSADQLTACVRAASARSSERAEISAHFALMPAFARVVGRVSASDEMDQPTYAGLFEIDASGNPTSQPLEAFPLERSGVFQLRAAHAGLHALVLVHAGSRPLTRSVDVHQGQVLDLGNLVLERGACVSGSVRTASGEPARGATIHVTPADAPRAVAMFGQPLVWIGNAFEHAARDFTSDERGAFEVCGLGAGDVVLTPPWSGALPQPALVLDDQGFAGAAAPWKPEPVRVASGARGVALEVRGFEATLVVRAAGRPLDQVDVDRLFDDGGFAGTKTGAQGRVALWSNAVTGLVRMRVSRVGYVAQTLTLDMSKLAPGEEIGVDLDVGLQPATLRFAALNVDWSRTSVFLWPRASLTTEQREILGKTGQPVIVPELQNRALDGAGRMLAPLDAGAWIVLLAPGEGSAEDKRFMPAVLEIELAPGEQRELAFEPRRPARLRFAPWPNGAIVRLERKDGTAVALAISSLVLRADARQGRTNTIGKLFANAPCRSQDLEPGEYVLTIEPKDGVARTQDVTLVAGGTVEVAGPDAR